MTEFMSKEKLQTFETDCLRMVDIATELFGLWKGIRDQIVELEKQSDNDDMVDFLNNELYSMMYEPWRRYKKIEVMMEETGTSEWLNDTISFDAEEQENVK